MSSSGWEQPLFIAGVTVVAAPLLGRYLAATFRGGRAPGDRLFLPVERLVYRVIGTDPDSSWDWGTYALAVLAFGLVSSLLLYAVLRFQGLLPLNPTHAPGMSSSLSFNTAVSFITGTNWQVYRARPGELLGADGGTSGRPVHCGRHRAVGGARRRAWHLGGRPDDRQLLGDLTRALVRVFSPCPSWVRS